MNDDLISRAAAIEALGEKPYLWTGCDYELGCANQYDLDKLAIETVPPAKPEIIRCKDCKWCENADGSMCKNPASWVVATDRDFGCVLAERRTDEPDK